MLWKGEEEIPALSSVCPLWARGDALARCSGEWSLCKCLLRAFCFNRDFFFKYVFWEAEGSGRSLCQGWNKRCSRKEKPTRAEWEWVTWTAGQFQIKWWSVKVLDVVEVLLFLNRVRFANYWLDSREVKVVIWLKMKTKKPHNNNNDLMLFSKECLLLLKPKVQVDITLKYCKYRFSFCLAFEVEWKLHVLAGK